MGIFKLLFPSRKPSDASEIETTCSNEDFKNIESNSFCESICTPIVKTKKWLGIAIDAPTEIQFGHSVENDYADCDYIANKVPKLIIAGIYSFEYAKIRGKKFTHDGTPFVHIKNMASEKTWGETIRDLERNYAHHVLGMNVSYDDRDIEEENMDNLSQAYSVGGYFNADIGMHMQRTNEAVDYEVHVEYGPYCSNRVMITVRP